VFIQPLLQKAFKSVDTCGVHNLHGMPGVVGGIVAAFVVPGVAKAELAGIAFTVLFALSTGFIGGRLIRLSGLKTSAYQDKAFLGIEDA
jgi:ammonium transporter Rh